MRDRQLTIRPSRLRLALLGTALALTLVGAVPAAAGENEAELPLGGLVFGQSEGMSIEEEVLQVSPERIQVQYRLLNRSPAPVTIAMTFPLPDIELSDPDLSLAIPGSDPVNFVGFTTKVDGKQVSFTPTQKAMMDERDVTARVRAAGLPVLPVGADPDAIQAAAAALPAAGRSALVQSGLLVELGTSASGEPLLGPGWTVRTSFTRQQVLPPNVPVLVEHAYKTSLGIGQDTVLRQALRTDKAHAGELERYKATYCVDDFLLKGIDKVAGTGTANTAGLQERRIFYALKASAAGPIPIRSFRLVIDKGRPDNLVSFCGSGVRKLSPTTFEFQRQDFTPSADLAILLVGTFVAPK